MCMKKTLIALFAVAAFASCKKSKDSVTCEVSVAGIAGNYKITKVIAYFPSPLPDQDVTASILDDCDKSGVYQLKSDKTITYTETASCSNDGTGTWDVVSGKLTINSPAQAFTDLPVSGWDCGTLVVTEDIGSGAGYKLYFTKQ